MTKGKSKHLVIQRHHLDYQRKDKVKEKKGETVLLYKGEHFVISQMQRRKHISRGFLKALEYWINIVKDDAIDLKEKEKDIRI